MAAAFRLGGLLRLRRLQEEQAAAELARANERRLAAEQRRQDTQDLLAGTTLPHHADLLSFRAAVASRAAMTGLVGEAVLAVQVAAARADRATDEWSGARTRAVTMGKLEDRHTAAVRAEEERLEQLLLDESATRRFAAQAATDAFMASASGDAASVADVAAAPAGSVSDETAAAAPSAAEDTAATAAPSVADETAAAAPSASDETPVAPMTPSGDAPDAPPPPPAPAPATTEEIR